jgi:hypothetical protein
MFVTSAARGERCKKVPSLSSASMTIHSPSPNAALLPTSFTSPPITKLGDHPARRRIRASIDALVVFPCEPATAIVLRVAASAASAAARCRTGIPRSIAVRSSTLRNGIAVEYTTASASAGTYSARLPTFTATPAAARRSSTAELLMSEPLTV